MTYEVRCPNCRKRYAIPDEKLNSLKNFICPACKTRTPLLKDRLQEAAHVGRVACLAAAPSRGRTIAMCNDNVGRPKSGNDREKEPPAVEEIVFRARFDDGLGLLATVPLRHAALPCEAASFAELVERARRCIDTERDTLAANGYDPSWPRSIVFSDDLTEANGYDPILFEGRVDGSRYLAATVRSTLPLQAEAESFEALVEEIRRAVQAAFPGEKKRVQLILHFPL